ncbi:MAG: PAS domain-containing protein [Candidatus Bathyarchaeia archaeon]|jgi:PAS domain S-box-containing protein
MNSNAANLLDVLNRIKDNIVALDNDYNITYANPAFGELFGLNLSEVSGKNIWEILPQDVKAVVHDKVVDTVEKKQIKQFEWEGIFAGRWWETTIYPSEKGITAITKDVTKRKEAEEALINTKKELAVILENIDDGFFSLDANWRFVYINSKAARNVGYEPEDLIGKNIWEYFPKVAKTNAGAQYHRAMTEQKTLLFEEHGVLTDRWYEETVYPTTQGIAVFWRDITEKKKNEEATEKQRKLGEAINKILKEALSTGDEVALGELCLSVAEELTNSKNGFIGEINEEGLEDIATSNPGWDNCYVIAPEGHRSRPGSLKTHGLYGKVLTQGKSFLTNDPANHPAHIGLPTGHPPLASFLGVPLINEGKTIGIVAVGNRQGGYTQNELESLEALAPSIVEAFLRKRAEVKLEQYSRHLESLVEERSRQLQDKERLAAIGATAGMVGHDIRNPLQAITSDVYLLKEYLKRMPEMKTKWDVTESLESIDQNVGYINKIVADLQDYARPLNPEYVEVDLAQLIGSIFTVIILPDNVKLSIDVKEFPKIVTDPMFIRRVLTNLVNNALQAMPEGGELQLEGTEHDNLVTITVSDTGVGIPEAVKPKLFTPMMTTKAKGQGLGLAVVKRLIEALGGQITFESQEGKGTTFIITLPAKR